MLQTQLVEHSQQYLQLLPEALRSRVVTHAHNGNSSYRFGFQNAADLQEFERCVVSLN